MIYILALFSYLMGSIPFALIVGKRMANKDIREHGSGNLGATNTFRVLGKKAGIIVAILDLLKGAIPVWLAMNFQDVWHPVLFGLLAVIGHTYPIFAQFKGGKAVATTGGLLLAFTPSLFMIGIMVFITSILTVRYVSVSSILASLIVAWMSYYKEDHFFFVVMIFISLFIIYRHRSNLVRLYQKKEIKLWNERKS